MNGQLFGSLPTGKRFYYYGDHEHIYIKTDDNFAVNSIDPGQPGIHPGAGVLVFTFDYYEQDNLNAHIGYLRDGHFVCLNCNDKHEGEPDARVFLCNIGPYKQTCHDCGRLVVLGRTPAWCELWD